MAVELRRSSEFSRAELAAVFAAAGHPETDLAGADFPLRAVG